MPKQNDLPSPVTYNQKFYAKAAGMDVDLPEAITPEQKYLKAIAEGGGVSPDDAYTKAQTDALLDGKVDKVTGKGLSTNDFTDAYKTELDGLDTALNGKVDKVTGKGLSTNDYTTSEKTKLNGIESGAEVNVQADWNQTDTTADDYIKNKPTIPDAQIQSDWNQTNTESKDFIKNKPAIPDAQVNSDWEASSGVEEILHKPTLGTAAAKDYTTAVSGLSDDLITSSAVNTALSTKANLVDGKVPASELPSYVDDTIEGYYYEGTFYEDSEHTTVITGETGKIYIDLTANKSYRWTGSVYTRIDECPAFGETQGTIYEGNKGKANADAIGTIANLTTTATDLVDAVNELNSGKVDKNGTDSLMTAAEHTKLSGIESGAEVNVQADWNQTDTTADDYIKNKPNIPSGVVVDQVYDATSTNAQSGVAIAGALSDKVDKVTGKGLSTNDYTNADKAKLDGLDTGIAKAVTFTTAANQYVYTNQSFTVPAGKVAIFTASVFYNDSKPNALKVGKNADPEATDEDATLWFHEVGEVSLGALSVSGITQKRNTNITYYIHAKYTGAGTNAVSLYYRII